MAESDLSIVIVIYPVIRLQTNTNTSLIHSILSCNSLYFLNTSEVFIFRITEKMLTQSISCLFFLAILTFSLGFRNMERNALQLRRFPTARFLFGSPEPPKAPAPKKEGGGLFGNMGNMMDTMKKAQEIAKQGEALNKELQELLITASDPSGQVEATFTGLTTPVGVKVSEGILSHGAEAVSLATTQAVIAAHQKSSQTMMSKMQALYAQFGLPMPPQK